MWSTDILSDEKFYEFYKTAETNDGGYLISGKSYRKPPDQIYLTILKIDKNGELQWKKEYPMPSSTMLFYGMKPANDGNRFVLYGSTCVNGKDTLTKNGLIDRN